MGHELNVVSAHLSDNKKEVRRWQINKRQKLVFFINF